MLVKINNKFVISLSEKEVEELTNNITIGFNRFMSMFNNRQNILVSQHKAILSYGLVLLNLVSTYSQLGAPFLTRLTGCLDVIRYELHEGENPNDEIQSIDLVVNQTSVIEN